MLRLLGYFAVLCLVLTVFAAPSAVAQDDAFGEIDLVYVESVEATPGQEIAVGFSLRNDEELSSFTIPVTYDDGLLTLKSVSFEGSRCEYIGTRIVTPTTITEANGHFMVSAAIIYEAPLAPGDGMLFTAIFDVSETAESGQSADIDTLFYPPGGELLLVEHSTLAGIHPAFQSGQVSVIQANRRPVFADIASQSVLESQTWMVEIEVADPDGDPVVIEVFSAPNGMTFVDNGDGTGHLEWTPDLLGPFSSDGSPFVVNLLASDGEQTAGHSVVLEVVNVNRRPVITAPTSVQIAAGESASFAVSALDPDFEEIILTFEDMPEGASYDGMNPGLFQWESQVTDSGARIVEIIATDPLGSADTARVTINIAAATLYALSLDDVSGMSNETVAFDVILDNEVAITGFDLLIHYDASALTVLDLTNTGTRSEGFEYFNVNYDEDGFPGNVGIVGIADQTGAGVPSLEAGDGAIAEITFKISSNLSFAGMTVPVRWEFLDEPIGNDNTLTDENGVKVEQEAIMHTDGAVNILDIGEINLGDINRNGLAYEISDVIYFTNYFMNPILYNFDVIQYANSDVNQDNLAATLADLVYLINIVISGGPSALKPLESEEELEATVSTDFEGGQLDLHYETDFEVGAVLVTLETESNVIWDDLYEPSGSMIIDYSVEAGKIRVLVYSMEGASLPAGDNMFLSIDNLNDFEIKAVELATSDGRHATVVQQGSPATLPEEYMLHQNYPNPFNPDTWIEFTLPQAGRVELTVYNVLGRKVKTLTNGDYPAGTHAVNWDGRDESGSRVSSGVYLYRFESGVTSLSKKMVLMK